MQKRLAKARSAFSAWWLDIPTGRTLVHSAAAGVFTYDFAEPEPLVA